MRFLILALVFCWSASAHADKPTTLELEKALASYRDSAALLHKADSFIYARRAYTIARQLYADKPESLGPIAYTYALAASRYQEPVALEQFEISIELMTKAFGPRSDKLAPVLVDAAEESIRRKEPEKAYLFTKHARELISLHSMENSFLAARAHMSLARQYWASGEIKRAEKHANQATQLADTTSETGVYPDEANLHFWNGQLMRWMHNFENASISYEFALQAFLEREPRNRKVLSIHKHMVEVSHHLNNFDRLAYHCVEAQRWQNLRGMSFYWPIYDPTGSIDQLNRTRKSQFIASFTRDTDCKAKDIIILKTQGISDKDAIKIVTEGYFAPRMRKGRMTANQRDDELHFSIYDEF